MKYRIKTINLFYYSVSIVISLMITSYLKNDYVTFICFNFLFSFIILEIVKRFYIKEIKITLSNESIFLEKTKYERILLKNIIGYNYRNSFKNHPSFKLIFKNKKSFKFNCLNKYCENLEDFIIELEKEGISNYSKTKN